MQNKTFIAMGEIARWEMATEILDKAAILLPREHTVLLLTL